MRTDRFPFRPSLTLDLDGPGGNIFEVVGGCRAVARQIGFPAPLIDAFSRSVMAAESYDAALAIVREWFDVRDKPQEPGDES